MTILIVGESGFLGSELVRQARTAGHTTVATYATAPGDASPTAWRPLDLRDAGSLDAIMAEVNPRVVINASSGRSIARRDGLDASRLPAGLRAGSAVPGALDVRLDSQTTQRSLRTRLRGARDFLRLHEKDRP